MCHFPQGFIITLLKSAGTLTLTLRGIIFHPEFSDTDLIRLKFQHIIFLFVRRRKKRRKNPSHSILPEVTHQDNFLTSKIFHFNPFQKLMASFDDIQKLTKEDSVVDS